MLTSPMNRFPLAAGLLLLLLALLSGTSPDGTTVRKWEVSTADAAPIPTPTAGSAQVLAAPVPNPVQFNFAPGTVVSSAQVNSNDYGLVNLTTSLISILNSCSFVPGGAISAVTLNSPLTGSLTACSANTGVGATLTLGLSHGDYADTTNAQTIGGAKTFTAAVTISALTTGTNPGAGQVTTTTHTNYGRMAVITKDGGTAATNFGSMNFGNPAVVAGNFDWQESAAGSFAFRRNDTGAYVPLLFGYGAGGSSTGAYTAPVYNGVGGAAGISVHAMVLNCTFGGLASTCPSAGSLVLSPAFASGTSYACYADFGSTAPGAYALVVGSKTASGAVVATSNGAVPAAGVVAVIFCSGT